METYRTAGKTVFFSGLAVMVGFSAIGLSTFKLYQSAAAVAVGVFILLIALATIVPFFMAVLWKKLFWPAKGKLEHKDSKLLDTVGRFALARPVIALLIVLGVTVPFLATYDGDLSYNSLEEVGEGAPAMDAFNIIADGFGPGQSMPTQIVIKNDERMDSSEYLGLAEKISQDLEKIDGVDKVRSLTRPMGEPLEDLLVSKQADTLEEGIGEGNKGIKQISEGLHLAGSELSKSEPQLKEATNGINSLVTGTNELKTGMGKLQSGLLKIEDGVRKGAMGSSEIKKALQEIKTNAEKLAFGSGQLLEGYKQAASGMSSIQGEYKKIGDGLQGLSNYLASTNQYFTSIEANPNYDGIKDDQDFLKLKTIVTNSQGQLQQLSSGITQLDSELAKIQGGISVANQSFATIIFGHSALNTGMGELINGIDQLQQGMTAAANGQDQVIGNLSKFTGGLTSINAGQQQLLDGFSDLGGQMGQLTDGLNQSATGLDEVHTGLNSARDYLSGLSQADQSLTGLYIPDELLKSKEFERVLDTYLSENRKVMTIDVIFKDNPYSNKAMIQLDEIKQTVKKATKETKLENATIAVGGITSTNADLSAMSKADYSRTVVLMLVGIALILTSMLRSFVMPIYLIASLIITYYTSMAITEVIYVNILGYAGISWAVPFFAFVILVALGIDYSIFLMDRFTEYKDKTIEEAMLLSMRKMGTVIISAAIILGGTFAAMMPAGVLSLLQIATIVLIGLFLYALVILPLFVRVMAKLFGKANWWHFIR